MREAGLETKPSDLPPTQDMNDNNAKKWTNLMGDNLQMKEISSSDSDKRACQPQDSVCIDFVGRFANSRDHEDGPIFQEAGDWLIIIGDKYVCPALEMGVRFMHVGQTAVIWSHSKFAYGPSTRRYNDYELPPNANVRYEVTVKHVYSPEEESDDPDGFQLRLALSKKQIGNDIFKNEWTADGKANEHCQQRALRMYKKSVEEMQSLLQTTAENIESGKQTEEGSKDRTHQAMDVMMDCLNNIVAVYMRAKEYHQAKEAAVQVLERDPENYKALLRAARASIMDPASTYEEADVALVAAEKVAQDKGEDGTDLRKLRQQFKQKKQEYRQRQKEMSARMQKGLQQQSSSRAEEEESEEGNPRQSLEEATKKCGSHDSPGEEEKSDSSNETTQINWKVRLAAQAFQILLPFVLTLLAMRFVKFPEDPTIAVPHPPAAKEDEF